MGASVWPQGLLKCRRGTGSAHALRDADLLAGGHIRPASMHSCKCGVSQMLGQGVRGHAYER
jgi:hypothetical protein